MIGLPLLFQLSRRKMMEQEQNPIRGGWFWCRCGKKIQAVDDKTTIIGQIYCRHCKTNHDIVIANGKLMQEAITPENQN